MNLSNLFKNIRLQILLFTESRPARKIRQNPESSRKNGFMLAELLCALLCAMITFVLALLLLKAGLKISESRNDRQELFGILQLREQAACSNRRSVKDSQLVLETGRETWTLYFDGSRLVKTPGYEIFLENLDSAAFESDEGHIDLIFEMQNREYRYQIC